MKEHDTQRTRSSSLLPIIALAAVFVALLRHAASISGIDRLWGLDLLFDCGPLSAILWTALCLVPALALLVPLARERVTTVLPKALPFLAPLLVAVLFLAAALFPMRTFFYGDGGPLTMQIWRLAMKEPVDAALLLNWKSSPLAGALLYGIAVAVPHALHLLSLPLPTHPTYPFIAQSLFFLALLGVYAFRNRKDASLAPQLLLLFGTAGVVFFFGYAEFYLPVFVFTFLYLREAERALDGGPLWPAVIALAGAVASMYAAAVLIPSLLVVVLARNPKRQRLATVANARWLLLAATGGYLLLLFAGVIGAGDSRVFMPLHPVETAAGTCAYTVFSSWHLADVANLLALLAPIPLVVLLAVLPARRSRSFRQAPRCAFYLLAGGMFFLFIFGANTSLGLARDWDLTAPLGVITGFFALALLRQREGTRRLSSSLALGALAALSALPWISVMGTADVAAIRFERIMALDSRHMYRDYALSGYEALRKYYQNSGASDKDLQLCRKKIELIDYASNYLLFIGKSSALLPKRPHDYLDAQRWALGRLQEKAEALRRLGKERDYDISIPQIDSLAELIAVNAFLVKRDSALTDALVAVGNSTGYRYPYPSILGMRAFLEGRFSDAAPLLQASLNHDFHHERVYLILGTALGILNRFSEALAIYNAGVHENPENLPLLITLAKYSILGKVKLEDAQLLLNRALELNPSPEQEKEIHSLLQQAGTAPQ